MSNAKPEEPMKPAYPRGGVPEEEEREKKSTEAEEEEPEEVEERGRGGAATGR
jgi:hypothetical protein